MFCFRITLFVGMLCLFISSAAAAQQPLQEIETRITDRVDNGSLVGISIGYVNAEGETSYVSKGVLKASGSTAVDRRTIFEIGSVTKLFTALAMARTMHQQGIPLDAEAEPLLPEAFDLPAYEGTSITVKHLLTHTSGLPKIPDNLTMSDPARPYAGYSEADLKSFLSGYELPREPGTKLGYSNIGMALVGYILEAQTNLTYEQVIRQFILDPLQMASTGIEINAADSSRVARGHRGGVEVPNWDITVFEGAGALHSTTADMVKFLKAQMGRPSPLKQAINMTQRPLFDAGKQKGKIQDKVGMGWFYATKNDTILWHNGATGGYKSLIGYNIEDDTGVVLLSNSASSTIDLGFHLLDPEAFPLQKITSLSKKELQKFVGVYRAGPAAKFHITRMNEQLFVRLRGQNKFPIYPKSETRFYLKAVPAEIQFEVTADSATKLILHQNGRQVPANRIER